MLDNFSIIASSDIIGEQRIQKNSVWQNVIRSGTDLVLLIILLFFLLGQPLQKSLRLHLFKSDRDNILQEFSSWI